MEKELTIDILSSVQKPARYTGGEFASIIKTPEETNLLVSWIKTKGHIKSINLVYRATDDGDKRDIFFEKCSDIGPNISLFEAANGRRFGGFTKSSWIKGQEDLPIKDEDAFLFSLDNKEQYKCVWSLKQAESKLNSGKMTRKGKSIQEIDKKVFYFLKNWLLFSI